jgi:hypothetical protein
MTDQGRRTFIKGICALASIAAVGGFEKTAEARKASMIDVEFSYKTILGDNPKEDLAAKIRLELQQQNKEALNCTVVSKKDNGDGTKTIRQLCEYSGNEESVIKDVKNKKYVLSVKGNDPLLSKKEKKIMWSNLVFYDEDKGIEHSFERYIDDLSGGVVKNNPILDKLVEDLTKGYKTQQEKAQSLLCFVQTGIEYEEMPDTGFVKSPLATLVQKKGDCKNKAVLYASLLSYLGVKPIFLIYDQHVNVGVPLDFEDNNLKYVPKKMILDNKVVHNRILYFVAEPTTENPTYIGKKLELHKQWPIKRVVTIN